MWLLGVYESRIYFYWFDSIFLSSLQNVCRLPFTRHSLYVDWLHNMLWKLCKHSRWMRLLRRCWRGRLAIVIYYGFDCTRTVYCDWHILQRIGGYNGWTTHLAEALSHTCKEDADKSELGLLFSLFSLHCNALNCHIVGK